jgi:hypothetical protein
MAPIAAGAMSRTSVENFIAYVLKSNPITPKPILGNE